MTVSSNYATLFWTDFTINILEVLHWITCKLLIQVKIMILFYLKTSSNSRLFPLLCVLLMESVLLI